MLLFHFSSLPPFLQWPLHLQLKPLFSHFFSFILSFSCTQLFPSLQPPHHHGARFTFLFSVVFPDYILTSVGLVLGTIWMRKSIFLKVWTITQYNVQFHQFSKFSFPYKQYSIVYIKHSYFQFIRWGTFRQFPFLSCCKYIFSYLYCYPKICK